MQNVAERLKEATHADAALIRVFDHKTQSYDSPTHIGFPSSYLEATRQVAPDSAIGTSFSTGEAIISANIREDPRLKGKKELEVGFASCGFCRSESPLNFMASSIWPAGSWVIRTMAKRTT